MSYYPLRLAFLLTLTCIPCIARAATDGLPNVLLIVTDEHNFRTLGCYRELLSPEQAQMWGSNVVVPTPHLDSLAKEGVICTRAYATSPVCSPSRAAMITGRYPHNVGVPTNDMVLDRSIPTLADKLNKAGYRSAFIGKWHLGGEGKPEWSPKVDGGFQFKKFMFNRGHWKKFVIANGEPAVGSQRNGEPNYNLDGADEKTFATDWLTDRAIDFITDADATKPFFTVISYPDPHGPNTVRAPYDHRFDGLRFSKPRTYQTGVAAPKWLGSTAKHPVFRGEEMSRYFGMVQCIDDNIGRLVARLKNAGQLDNTLIIMTSDHGDLCYEHDRLNKGNPYEGSARVPLILRLPKRIAGQQVYRQPIGTVDLTPTVMGLLKLPSDPADQGRNLSAVLADASQAKTDNEHPPMTFLRNSGKSAAWVAAVDARYKLILSVNDDPWLFDAEQDPDELLNYYLRPGTAGVAERLAKALRDYGLANKDPYLSHPKISASLDEVLGSTNTEKPKLEKSECQESERPEK
jgi:arylsulfatase A-like enzyme